MNFCATCGRERSGDSRFCGGCGSEFAAATAAASAAPAEEPARWDPPAEPARWDPPADATRIDRQPDATMIDRPGSADPARAGGPAEPDPFAAWFAPDAQAAPRTEPAGQWQAAPRQAPEPWQAADTVYAGPGQRGPGFPPPAPPAPGYPPPRPPYGAQPGPPPGGRRSSGAGRPSGGRRAAFILVIALVMLAAGGGAYVLVARSGKHSTAQPPATHTATSSAKPTAPSSAASSASASPTGSASASASASATATASPTASLVSVGPGISNPAEPAVETTLSHYFQGINTHNYAEYQSAHNAQEQAAESQLAFASGFQSTTDSAMTLVSLEATADGGESATVTFTSHQNVTDSIDGHACNNWQLTFSLVPQGTGYLIGPPSPGYKPIYSDC
jgi:hypothetical protein